MVVQIQIKNMISRGDARVVREEIEKHGGACLSVEMGVATLAAEPRSDQYAKIREALIANGYDIIHSKNEVIVEKIKAVVIETIRTAEARTKPNFTEILSERLGRNYRSISAIFSETEGITIEQFIIAQRIARAKELLLEGSMTLAQIADQLHYSSPSHLSTQFKHVAGMTPSSFRDQRVTGLD